MSTGSWAEINAYAQRKSLVFPLECCFKKELDSKSRFTIFCLSMLTDPETNVSSFKR